VKLFLIYVILLFSISGYGKPILENKPVVLKYFKDDKCFNYNENYICLPNKSPTDKLQILMQTPATPIFNDRIDFTKKDVFNFLYKKVKISEYKIHHDTKYSKNGKQVQLKGYKRLKPLYNEQLSFKFQTLFLSNLKVDDDVLNKSIDEYISNILNLIKSDSFIIKISNYNNIYVYINPSSYPKAKPIIEKILTLIDLHKFNNSSHIQYKIDKLSILLKNNQFDNKLIVELNNLISSIINDFINMRMKQIGNQEKYFFIQAYKLALDFILLNDKNDILKNIGFNLDSSSIVKAPFNMIREFYQKNPLKVFITQTNNYHTPKVDGVYGYLYIHKYDYKKYTTLNLLDYLLMHEVQHNLLGIISKKRKFLDWIDRLNLEKLMLLNKNPNSIFFKLIELYDDKNINTQKYLKQELIQKFKKEQLEVQEISNNFKKKIFNEIKAKENKKIFLSPSEELKIDLYNISLLSLTEQESYYRMLKSSLSTNSYRLKTCKIDLELNRIKNNFKYNNFDFVKLIDYALSNLDTKNMIKDLKYSDLDELDNIIRKLQNLSHKQISQDSNQLIDIAISIYGRKSLSEKLINLKKYLYLKKQKINTENEYIKIQKNKGEL